MVRDKWNRVRSTFPENSYSLNIWHECIQSLRKVLRGWNLKEIGKQKLTKLGWTKRVEVIDSIAEHRLLSMEEWEERIDLESKLEETDRLENLQWKQKAGKN
jgi:hypothetical protein